MLMTDNVLVRKLRALIIVRAVFVTFLLGSFFVLQVGYKSFPHPRAISTLIIVLYILTIIYSILLNRIKRLYAFAYAQLLIDVMATNLLIYLTGGIESRFSFIIPLTVISASAVLNRQSGYVIATFNSILYGAIIDLQYYRILPMDYDAMLTEKDFLYTIVAHISAFYLVAFLSGYLSSRLEKTAKALEQTDSTLRELSLFNKELIENIPSGIFTTDVNGYLLTFNRAAENITGVNRDSAMGMRINEIFPSLEQIDDIARVETIIRHPTEGERIIGLTISSLRDVSGERTGFIGIFQDLTQLKKMEADMKQKEKWAAIGELSANIAHEIRNPLAALKGSVEMLREDRITEEHKEKLTAIALSEMERLNKIITDFLTYSRPSVPSFGMFDLNLVLDDTLELLKNTVPFRNDITIRKNFNGPLSINADQQKLRQVFWNLGMNAIEAMPEGGELSVTSKRENNLIEVIFEDTGVGIEQDNINKVFYPFFSTKEGGTGLGLAIAYRIIEEHHGKISILSRHGEGATFRITLPDHNGISH